jgi:hypothetical protein
MKKVYRDSLKAWTIGKKEWEDEEKKALQSGDETIANVCAYYIKVCDEAITQLEELSKQEEEDDTN